MKEHPILFSSEMVRAILEGRKTMTRRVCKYLHPEYPDNVMNHIIGVEEGYLRYTSQTDVDDYTIIKHKCPYGKVGDRLWVRETHNFFDGGTGIFIRYLADGETRHVQDNSNWLRNEDFGKIKPSIFMPRWASRITLEITDIRVERLQEITEEDVIREGTRNTDDYEDHIADDRDFRLCPDCGGSLLHGALGESLGYMEVDCTTCNTFRKRFHILWNVINCKKHPWESNPWVWVIEFKRIK